MTFEQIMELVGYFASLLVLVSLLMTSVVKLRIINSLGAIIYVIYALTIKSYPTAIMNLCLVVINIWQLVRMGKPKALFVLRQLNAGEVGLARFLECYGQDIRKYFPDFSADGDFGNYIAMVYADADPVGLVMGYREGNTLRVTLDYSIPRYRDCSVGKFLYGQLKEQGVCRLEADPGDPVHSGYLKKMGFSEAEGMFIKEL